MLSRTTYWSTKLSPPPSTTSAAATATAAAAIVAATTATVKAASATTAALVCPALEPVLIRAAMSRNDDVVCVFIVHKESRQINTKKTKKTKQQQQQQKQYQKNQYHQKQKQKQQQQCIEYVGLEFVKGKKIVWNKSKELERSARKVKPRSHSTFICNFNYWPFIGQNSPSSKVRVLYSCGTKIRALNTVFQKYTLLPLFALTPSCFLVILRFTFVSVFTLQSPWPYLHK